MRWTATERHAQSLLRPSITPFERLAVLAHGFVASGIATCMPGRAKPPGHAAEVQARLLVRLSHDLRVVELAASRSYSLQALGLAAGIYELSHAVAFIGSNAARATEWERHQDTQRTYPSTSQRREAVRASLLTLIPDVPDIESRIEDQEALYTAFCMAKHGNPKTLRRFGVTVTGTTVRLYHGPFVSSYVIRQAQVALYHCARMVAVATMIFAGPLLPGATSEARRKYRRRQARIVNHITALSGTLPFKS